MLEGLPLQGKQTGSHKSCNPIKNDGKKNMKVSQFTLALRNRNKNQQSDMCANQSLRSALTLIKSDQNRCCALKDLLRV